LHSITPEDTQTLLEMLEERLQLKEFFIELFSPDRTVHVGSSAIGVQFIAGVS